MIEIIRKSPKGKILFLHGMGGAVEMYRDFFASSALNFDFYFPLSPLGECGWIGAKDFRCWFDVQKAGDREVRDDARGSAKKIKDLVMSLEVDFLGGFSQGAAMALYTALSEPDLDIKGVFGLSGYNMDYTIANETLPVFLYHGGKDKTCGYRYASSTYSNIKNRVFYSEADLDHSFSNGEMLLLNDWLTNLMPPTPKI